MMQWILSYLLLGAVGSAILCWVGHCARTDLVPVKIPLIMIGLFLVGSILNGVSNAEGDE